MVTTDLFDPVRLGSYELRNRIVMAPLTRSRADDNGVPGELQATYYAQRASAGLIVTEATNITPQGKGYIRTPGIWSDQQIAGWKRSLPRTAINRNENSNSTHAEGVPTAKIANASSIGLPELMGARSCVRQFSFHCS